MYFIIAKGSVLFSKNLKNQTPQEVLGNFVAYSLGLKKIFKLYRYIKFLLTKYNLWLKL